MKTLLLLKIQATCLSQNNLMAICNYFTKIVAYSHEFVQSHLYVYVHLLMPGDG